MAKEVTTPEMAEKLKRELVKWINEFNNNSDGLPEATFEINSYGSDGVSIHKQIRTDVSFVEGDEE